MRKRIAIIGASTGQLPLCEKAKSLNLETYCFAYDKDAVCKDIVDHFYPISIFEMDKIVEKCKEIGVDGVVSNASDATAEVVAYVAEKLALLGPSYKSLVQLRDKYYVRNLSSKIEGFISPTYYKYEGVDKGIYPCVVKPCRGGAKKGVSFVADASQFMEAIHYAQNGGYKDIVVEEYIEGKEISVETISYRGKHYVIQITDKDSSAAPHFVELGHHQPADLSDVIRKKINYVIPQLLTELGFDNGASHIEIKYNEEQLFLVEANLRGGGDFISNKLVYLSSMIEVAMDNFKSPQKTAPEQYAGIYYLCKQTEYFLPFFEEAKGKSWLVEEVIFTTNLQESFSNYERNGYLIYKSDRKIEFTK